MARTSTLLVVGLAASASGFAIVAPPSLQPRFAIAPRVAALAPQPAFAVAPLQRVATMPEMMADDAIMKETSMRSLVKAVGWRIVAGIVTAITSYIFTKSLAAAAAIVGWDLCSKSVTMFIGERIWNNFNWGKEKGADSSKRSLAKAIAWRIFAAFNTLVGATLLNKGNVGVAGKIAGSDSIVKTVLFYFYERTWAVIAWGKVAADAEAATE